MSEKFEFKDLTSYLTSNPLVLKVSTLIESVLNLDFYTFEDVSDPVPKRRVITYKNNRLRIYFRSIDKKGTISSKRIEFGILCDKAGKSYTDEEVIDLIKNEGTRIEDLYIKFTLNYHFKDFIKKTIIQIKSNDSKVNEHELEKVFTFQDYLNTSKNQFNYILPKEIVVLEDLRKFIYDNCIKYAKTLAYNFATNSCRHSGELDRTEYNVSNQKYGAVYLTNEFFRKNNFDQKFINCGLQEHEIAFIKELVAHTVLYGYKTNTFTMSDKSNFSLSGYTSSSNTTDLAVYLSKEDLISKINAEVMDFYLNMSIRNGQKINVLLDSTIIFTDGSSLTSNKDTYSNTKGFGRGIKAIMLVTEQGFPLIFNVTSGNEPDVVTIPHILEKLELYCSVPKNQLTIVCDAGYFSKNNILYIISKGYDVNVVGKDINFIKSIINKVRTSDLLLSRETTFREMYLPVELPLRKYITKSDISRFTRIHKDLDIDLAKIESQKIKIVLIYNLDLKADETALFNENIYKFLDEIDNTKDKTKLLKHSYITKHKYFKPVTDDNGNIVFKANCKNIDEKSHRLGFNTIFSTLADSSCKDIVDIYKSRINIEVLFKLCKQLLGLDAVRVHKDHSLQLKILIIQIAIGMINDLNNNFNTPYRDDFPISKDDHKKLLKEYPTIFKLISFIHSDLSFEQVNNVISYKSMNKLTRNALSLFKFRNPIEDDFIKLTYSYRKMYNLLEKSKQ